MTVEEWQKAIVKASEPGEASVPEALFQIIEAQADPIRALADWDLSNTLFASLHGEYPFFRQRLPNEEPLPEDENARGVEVLRWLIDQFRGWSVASDPKLACFVALVVIIQSCPWDSTAWFLLYTERNCLVSRFQQYAHSISTSSEEDWLADSPIYQSSWPSTTYAALRFSLKGDPDERVITAARFRPI